MKPSQKDRPSWLKHLNEDVVVYIRYEVRHFVVGQVEPVELSLQVGAQTTELLLVWHGNTPGEGEGVLDFFEFEHEREDLVVVVHHLFSEDRRQRSQIRHFIVKQECLPTAIFLGSLEKLDVESANELLLVELSVWASYRCV